MGQRGQLDRLPVAHAGSVTSLDWCPPSGDGAAVGDMPNGGLGWIVSGSMDRSVKVPLHTFPSVNHPFTCDRCGISIRPPLIFPINPRTVSIRLSLCVVFYGEVHLIIVNSRW